MKGLIAKSVAAMWLLSGLAGCECYRNLVDPCYPERYEFAARKEVCKAFVPQVNNGHVLDQTVWNYHFEPGTDRLTVGGQSNLARLARRRPAPDSTIYLQTAQDIEYEAATPDKFSEGRTSLDGRRAQAVQKYLTAITADRPQAFDVVVHDPPETGMSAVPMANAITARNNTALIVPQNIQTSAPGRFPGSTATTAGGR